MDGRVITLYVIWTPEGHTSISTGSAHILPCKRCPGNCDVGVVIEAIWHVSKNLFRVYEPPCPIETSLLGIWFVRMIEKQMA